MTAYMLLKLCVVVTVVFGAKDNQRTFADVRECTEGNYTTCQSYCKKWHPTYKDYGKVQKCFEQKRQDFQDCMEKLGVLVDDFVPCYAQTDEKRTRDEVDDQLAGPVKCYKRCIKRAGRKCRKGCNSRPPVDESERKRKLQECKNDEILDCLEAEENSSARTPQSG